MYSIIITDLQTNQEIPTNKTERKQNIKTFYIKGMVHFHFKFSGLTVVIQIGSNKL